VLDQFNLLVLNKEVLEHEDSWTEQDIESRSVALASSITEVWQGPDAAIQAAAFAALRSDQSVMNVGGSRQDEAVARG
jgi:hypothetical protein